MRYMLDTDVCIDMIHGKHPEQTERVRENLDECCMSAITYMELSIGTVRGRDPTEPADIELIRRDQYALEMFAFSIRVLPFDGVAAAVGGAALAMMMNNGSSIGEMDTLIASHAKSLGLTLVTRNLKDFGRFEGLKVERWCD